MSCHQHLHWHHLMVMVLSVAPLHSLGQDIWNEVQYVISYHVMPLAVVSHNTNGIINGTWHWCQHWYHQWHQQSKHLKTIISTWQMQWCHWWHYHIMWQEAWYCHVHAKNQYAPKIPHISSIFQSDNVQIWYNYFSIYTLYEPTAIINVTQEHQYSYTSYYWHMPLNKYPCTLYICVPLHCY